MSSESVHAEEMIEVPRNEWESLVNRVDELEEKLQTVADSRLHKVDFHKILRSLSGMDAGEYPMTPNTVGNEHLEIAAELNHHVTTAHKLAQQHQRIVEDERTFSGNTKDKAWWSVLELAKNTGSNLPNNRVQLDADELVKATGYSRRRCVDLIDEWAEDHKQGVEMRPYKPPSKATGGEPKKKRLVLDLSVWGDDE